MFYFLNKLQALKDFQNIYNSCFRQSTNVKSFWKKKAAIDI